MKTELIDAAKSEATFPGLYRSCRNGVVVLMWSRFGGVVVASPTVGEPFGHHSQTWNMDLLTPVPSGTKVILTQE